MSRTFTSSVWVMSAKFQKERLQAEVASHLSLDQGVNYQCSLAVRSSCNMQWLSL